MEIDFSQIFAETLLDTNRFVKEQTSDANIVENKDSNGLKQVMCGDSTNTTKDEMLFTCVNRTLNANTRKDKMELNLFELTWTRNGIKRHFRLYIKWWTLPLIAGAYYLIQYITHL